MNQTDLFDQPTAPHNRTETSIEAAIAIQPKIKKGQQTILNAVELAPEGYTREEIATATGLPLATVCARVNELVKDKKLSCRMIFDPKAKPSLILKKITRPTKSGRKAEVLFLF
jgi:hypothetical protein